MMQYIDFLAKAVDNNITTGVLYTDYSKYFDTIPHAALIHVLKVRYGFGGNLLRWIQNWLTGRSQRVIISETSTEWKDVKSSVVQGSVLGVCLAILYVDGIDEAGEPAKVF